MIVPHPHFTNEETRPWKNRSLSRFSQLVRGRAGWNHTEWIRAAYLTGYLASIRQHWPSQGDEKPCWKASWIINILGKWQGELLAKELGMGNQVQGSRSRFWRKRGASEVHVRDLSTHPAELWQKIFCWSWRVGCRVWKLIFGQTSFLKDIKAVFFSLLDHSSLSSVDLQGEYHHFFFVCLFVWFKWYLPRSRHTTGTIAI